MSIVGCVRRVADAALIILPSTLVAVVFCLAGSGQAFAIPSPELVVGSFVSISQLLALMSAVLGGGAAYATMRARRRGGSAAMSRGLFYVAAGLFAAMTTSIIVNIWQYVGQSNERPHDTLVTSFNQQSLGGEPIEHIVALELSDEST